jgi:HlyD family secretion protein
VRKTILIVLILVVAAGGLWLLPLHKEGPGPHHYHRQGDARRRRRDRGATGTLQAVTTVQVGTQVSGTILELNADFNSLVRKAR